MKISNGHWRDFKINIDHWVEPCMHDSCSQCHGTGRKADGSSCIHMISCNCPRCTVQYFYYVLY